MNDSVIKIFVGYDPVEEVAWHTMVSSIMEHSTRPVAIIPISIKNLSKIYTRKRDPKQSNEFSFSRFLVPYLCDYSGYGIFFDCDMLLRTDVSEIFSAVSEEPDAAAYVVKHDYSPKNKTKYLGNIQYSYPRKNWSSVVLWNAGHKANAVLTPEFINTAPPEILHRFQWLEDNQIGSLDQRWNWLVGEYDNAPKDVKNIHWTIGGPYFNEYNNVEFSDEWRKQLIKINYCKQRELI